MNADNGGGAAKEAVLPTHISLVMDKERIGDFFPIMQRGFLVPAWLPCTAGNLLHEQFGLEREYISERITTIFLDGKAIDDPDEALVSDHSTIALSAAMPGVVGASLRRGSFYAAMRDAVTYTEREIPAESFAGVVRIKIFNLLLNELGPVFLKRGIIMTPSDLSDFILDYTETVRQGCHVGARNGRPFDPFSLTEGNMFGKDDIIKLSIEFR
jgi:hypothetical protein